MNTLSNEAAQREEFFKKSFRGNFSYNVKVSSVNSFLRSMTPGNMQPSDHEHQNNPRKIHRSGSTKDSSIH